MADQPDRALEFLLEHQAQVLVKIEQMSEQINELHQRCTQVLAGAERSVGLHERQAEHFAEVAGVIKTLTDHVVMISERMSRMVDIQCGTVDGHMEITEKLSRLIVILERLIPVLPDRTRGGSTTLQ